MDVCAVVATGTASKYSKTLLNSWSSIPLTPTMSALAAYLEVNAAETPNSEYTINAICVGGIDDQQNCRCCPRCHPATQHQQGHEQFRAIHWCMGKKTLKANNVTFNVTRRRPTAAMTAPHQGQPNLRNSLFQAIHAFERFCCVRTGSSSVPCLRKGELCAMLVHLHAVVHRRNEADPNRRLPDVVKGPMPVTNCVRVLMGFQRLFSCCNSRGSHFFSPTFAEYPTKSTRVYFRIFQNSLHPQNSISSKIPIRTSCHSYHRSCVCGGCVAEADSPERPQKNVVYAASPTRFAVSPCPHSCKKR